MRAGFYVVAAGIEGQTLSYQSSIILTGSPLIFHGNQPGTVGRASVDAKDGSGSYFFQFLIRKDLAFQMQLFCHTGGFFCQGFGSHDIAGSISQIPGVVDTGGCGLGFPAYRSDIC